MKITVIVILVLLLITVILTGIICIQKEKLKETKKEKQSLKDQVQQLQKNVAYLVRHAQEMAQIQKEKEKTFKRIEEARTDEEISNIVDTIICLNNERLQNMSKG